MKIPPTSEKESLNTLIASAMINPDYDIIQKEDS